jgi:hypothetical protein
MGKKIIIILLAIQVNFLFAQELTYSTTEANNMYEKGDFKGALSFLDSLIKFQTPTFKEFPSEQYYLLTLIAVGLNDFKLADSAMMLYNRNIKYSITKYSILGEYPIYQIRDSEFYRKWAQIFIAQIENKNPILTLKLYKLEGLDQTFREAHLNAIIRKDKKETDKFDSLITICDAITLDILEKEIFTDGMFPTIDDVGLHCAQIPYLILQHSSLETRKRFINQIKNAFKTKNLNSELYAMIIDRNLVESHKKQLYGTQFKRFNDGRCIEFPIRFKSRVNIRRKKLGLNSFEQYKKYVCE